MKTYSKMIGFIFIMGFITSVVFVGMDVLTAERIEANKNAAIYSAVLSHNNISFNNVNIIDVFNEFIETTEAFEVDLDGETYNIVLYVNKDNGQVSFQFGIFSLGGLWGPVGGIITLESDFETVVNVTILNEVETPGLGGKIKDRKFLDQFIGLKLDVNSLTPVMVRKDSADNLFNEVDEIAGATGTSTAFEKLLNQSYALYMQAWEARGK
jgi:Na+-transporting NADH:ubiquinone oxidoreductase subunit C